MPRFAANLGFLFPELPLLERFAAAREAGFAAVEIQGPGTATNAQIAAAAREAGVEIVLCNIPVGDLLSGGCGLSGVAGRQGEFQDAVRWGSAFAQAIGCSAVNIGPSRVVDGSQREANLAVLIENLQFAGELLGAHGIRVLVEPVSYNDFAHTLLHDADDAMAVIRDCAHPNVFLQFDVYHMHQMHADALATLRTHIASVAHIQFADVPGRGAPGTGLIDFTNFFATVDRLGYAGWTGAEYRPAGRTIDTLAWLPKQRSKESS